MLIFAVLAALLLGERGYHPAVPSARPHGIVAGTRRSPEQPPIFRLASQFRARAGDEIEVADEIDIEARPISS
jgi:hypothetical protein